MRSVDSRAPFNDVPRAGTRPSAGLLPQQGGSHSKNGRLGKAGACRPSCFRVQSNPLQHRGRPMARQGQGGGGAREQRAGGGVVQHRQFREGLHDLAGPREAHPRHQVRLQASNRAPGEEDAPAGAHGAADGVDERRLARPRSARSGPGARPVLRIPTPRPALASRRSGHAGLRAKRSPAPPSARPGSQHGPTQSWPRPPAPARGTGWRRLGPPGVQAQHFGRRLVLPDAAERDDERRQMRLPWSRTGIGLLRCPLSSTQHGLTPRPFPSSDSSVRP